MEELKIDLTKMGYRMVSDNIWGKPVGFHFFTFEFDKLLWTNFFKGADNTICIWNSEKYKEDDWKMQTDNTPLFLSFLKCMESYTKTDCHTESSFEFLTIEEQYKLEF